MNSGADFKRREKIKIKTFEKLEKEKLEIGRPHHRSRRIMEFQLKARSQNKRLRRKAEKATNGHFGRPGGDGGGLGVLARALPRGFTHRASPCGGRRHSSSLFLCRPASADG